MVCSLLAKIVKMYPKINKIGDMIFFFFLNKVLTQLMGLEFNPETQSLPHTSKPFLNLDIWAMLWLSKPFVVS